MYLLKVKKMYFQEEVRPQGLLCWGRPYLWCCCPEVWFSNTALLKWVLRCYDLIRIDLPECFSGGMHFSSPMEITLSQPSPTSWSTPAVASSLCSSTISSAGGLIIRFIIPLDIKFNFPIITGVQQSSEERRGCLWCWLPQGEIFQLEGLQKSEKTYIVVLGIKSVSHNS